MIIALRELKFNQPLCPSDNSHNLYACEGRRLHPNLLSKGHVPSENDPQVLGLGSSKHRLGEGSCALAGNLCREKKDLPLEANLFWFEEGICPERFFVGLG
jgi:hypothetical protein